MGESVRQTVLKYLGAVSITVGTGVGGPAAALAEVPGDLALDVLDEASDAEWQSADRRRLLALLAQDPRAFVRARVAEQAGALAPEASGEAESILRALARDRDGLVRVCAATGLADAIRRASPVDRLRLVSEWSGSPDGRDRAALARALADRVPVMIADLALDVLAHDPSPEVRRAALFAASRRFGESPDEYRRVASRLLDDPERAIRRAARRLVTRTA